MSVRPPVSRAGLWALLGYAAGLILFAAELPLLRAELREDGLRRGLSAVLWAGAGTGLAVTAGALRRRPLRRLAGLAGVAALAAVAARFAPGETAGLTRLAEQTHLAQYGILSLGWALVFRRALADAALHTTGIAFTTAVGVVDEWVQWWVPERVGVLADLRLDFAGGVLGQALAAWVVFAGDRPLRLGRRGWALTLRAAAGLVVLIGGFVHCVHLGHLVELPAAGVRFRSRFEARELLGAAEDWSAPPARPGPLRRLWQGEDFFLAEARHHAQRRNEALMSSQPQVAFQHQAVLDAFYAPVLVAFPDLAVPPPLARGLEGAGKRAREAPLDAGPPGILPSPDPLTWWLAVGFVAATAAFSAELLAVRRSGAGEP